VKYLYQQKGRLFAQTAPGLESIAVDELKAIGAVEVEARFMGVSFTADKAVMYRANYQARLVSRILAPIAVFPFLSEDDLYQKAVSLRWTDFLKPHQTFAIYATRSKNSRVKHTGYAALKIKDAVADFYMLKFRNRPDVNKNSPDVWINVHFDRHNATISIDTSGGSLHKRGYRHKTVKAPMQETLAAAVIHFSKWDGTLPLYDPMCGSGTLLSEALMKYALIPAGFLRKKFGFENLPDFDPLLWRQVKTAADKRIRPLPPGLVGGSDMSDAAVDAALANNRRLPFGNRVVIQKKQFQQIEGLPGSLIVCNPPYGIRLENKRDTATLYGILGDYLKQRCKGATAYLYFGDRDLIKNIGLKPEWKKPLKNGGLDGRLVKYLLY